MYERGVFRFIIWFGLFFFIVTTFIFKAQTVKLCEMYCLSEYKTDSFRSGVYDCFCYFNRTQPDIIVPEIAIENSK